MSGMGDEQSTSGFGMGVSIGTGVHTILFMVVVTAVFITAVSLVHLVTRERITINESLFLKRAVLYAANIDVPAGSREVERFFAANVKEMYTSDTTGRIFHIVDTASGDRQGCVFVRHGAGLWGTIEAVIGYDRDLKTITGIDFTRQNETPGLGGRIAESWFKEQFRNKPLRLIMKAEGEAAAHEEFDAITGATITSTAVLNILNHCADNLDTLRSGGEE